MTGFLTAFEHFLSDYGALALFVTVALEALGAPLPGESAIIAASAAVAAGKLSITSVVLAAFLGSVLGDNIGYLIGRKLGRPVILRHGARFGVTDAGLARAEEIVRRRGSIIVVAARFIVLLRQLNGLVAGTTNMPWGRFLVANICGAALWVGLWTTLAYKLGRREAEIVPWIWHHLALVAAIATPLLILALLAARALGRKGR